MSVTLAAGLLPGVAPAPATATVSAPGPRDPLAGLAVHPEWGSITGTPGVLRRSCHRYTYRYAVTPPEGIWAIEVYITGPGLQHLAGGAFLDGYDPLSGTGRFTLCRNTTRYGRFTIQAKVSVDDGAGHITEGKLPVDHFRLRRPRR